MQIVKAKEGQQSLFYEKFHWYANVVCISYSTQCDVLDSKSKSPTKKCPEIKLVIFETSKEEVRFDIKVFHWSKIFWKLPQVSKESYRIMFCKQEN